MKKLTLSALAVLAVAGTSFAGPTVVTSKEFKQPCVTPCFRDQEFQLDLFYSYNDAAHQGNSTASDSFRSAPVATPVAAGVLPGSTALLNDPTIIPPGSTVIRSGDATVKAPQYFNDGSGGGVGMNYFFARYFGIGVEGNWWEGTQTSVRGDASVQDVVTLTGINAGTANVVAANIRAAGGNVAVLDPSTLLFSKSKSFNRVDKKLANQVTGSLILRYPFEGPICWAPYIFGGGGGIFDHENVGFGHIGVGAEFRVTPYMGFFADWRWEFMSGHNSNVNDRVRDIAREAGLSNIDINNRRNNDVNMTRVGVRFVF